MIDTPYIQMEIFFLLKLYSKAWEFLLLAKLKLAEKSVMITLLKVYLE
jgi:hypothetical protein